MKKALVIYDLDGTLVDSRKDIFHAANHMLKHFGKHTLSQEEVNAYVGRGMQELVSDCLQTGDDALIQEGMQVYRTFYGEHLLDYSFLYPKTLELLEYFKDRKQVVLTNKPNPFTEALLKGLNVHQYFCRIVSGNSGFPKKPDPSSAIDVIQKSGVSVDAAVFVGDSPVDIQTGRAVGMQTVALAQGFVPKSELQAAAPDFLFDDSESFWELVQSQQW